MDKFWPFNKRFFVIWVLSLVIFDSASSQFSISFRVASSLIIIFSRNLSRFLIAFLAFEDTQYFKLAEVINCLMRNYEGLTPERIVSHADIAPNRKTDPGPLFDWKRLKTMIK